MKQYVTIEFVDYNKNRCIYIGFLSPNLFREGAVSLKDWRKRYCSQIDKFERNVYLFLHFILECTRRNEGEHSNFVVTTYWSTRGTRKQIKGSNRKSIVRAPVKRFILATMLWHILSEGFEKNQKKHFRYWK